MTCGVAGKSLIAFGAVSIIGALGAAFFLDALGVDFLALFVIEFGISVRNGSRRACRWAIGLMAFYLAVTLVTLVVATRHPDGLLGLGSPQLRTARLAWAFAWSGLVAVWSAVNIALLMRALRSSGKWSSVAASADGARRLT